MSIKRKAERILPSPAKRSMEPDRAGTSINFYAHFIIIIGSVWFKFDFKGYSAINLAIKNTIKTFNLFFHFNE